ncbi:hypothetical protein ACFU3O_01915 [Streptomyces antibioticus]|uniref:hypothetical protein n=1 Tax=Streptomyces antibioticus TaxID=1890 RepID=UPI003685C02E
MNDPYNLPTPLTAGRRGYPNRAALDHAESRLRAQLARLARDPDTIEQAGQLAQAAADALFTIWEAANKVEENSPRHRARMKRQQQRLTRAFERRGVPVPPPLLNAPENSRDGA